MKQYLLLHFGKGEEVLPVDGSWPVGMWEAAEAKLAELKAFLDSAPRKDGKLTRAAEAGARKVLEAG